MDPTSKQNTKLFGALDEVEMYFIGNIDLRFAPMIYSATNTQHVALLMTDSQQVWDDTDEPLECSLENVPI